ARPERRLGRDRGAEAGRRGRRPGVPRQRHAQRQGQARHAPAAHAVSFQSPAYLLTLALVPLAAWLYLIADRRRRAGAARFAAPRLLPSVAPVRPGFRRHLPRALYGFALAAIAAALARPQVTV